MAFVNEHISAEDYEKYIETYKRQAGAPGLFLEDWTIDRERECYLTCTHTVRQDMYEGNYSITKWLFFWEGRSLTIILK